MKQLFFLAALLLLFAGCGSGQPETTDVPDPPAPETTLPAETEPLHTELYIPGVTAEEVCLYFREVCLAAEFVNGGDPSLLQKWDIPIWIAVHGEPTEADRITLRTFLSDLNKIEGFPGISETDDPLLANLHLYFCSQQELLDRMGEEYAGLDGAVTFWYNNNAIYDAIICCRTDLSQELRNSVILEELYNGLGPIQDTVLRPDSIIWQEFSQPQSLTEMDTLILKLLYHPEMQCGMHAEECEAVIRELYY